MFNVFSFLVLISIFSINAYSSNEAELKKSHLEDIFIWKMSDELKLTAKQEKQFTEISKSLNKKKSELNKKIQEAVQNLKTTDSETQLKSWRRGYAVQPPPVDSFSPMYPGIIIIIIYYYYYYYFIVIIILLLLLFYYY
jgi:hypothetical protein